MGLLGCKGSDGGQHGGVNGTSIEKEGAQDFLDMLGILGIEGR